MTMTVVGLHKFKKFLFPTLALVLFGAFILDQQNNKKFDQHTWLFALKGKSDHEYVEKQALYERATMVRDLKKNYLSKGMHKADVIKLLGSPETIDGHTPIERPDHKGCIIYELGSNQYSDESLFVCFNKDNQIEDVLKIYTSW